MLRYTSRVVCDSGQRKRPFRTPAVPDSGDAPVDCAEPNCPRTATGPRIECPDCTRATGVEAASQPDRHHDWNLSTAACPCPEASRRGSMRNFLEKNANRTDALRCGRPRQRRFPTPDDFERLHRTRRDTPVAGARAGNGRAAPQITPPSPRTRRTRRSAGPSGPLLQHSVRIGPLAVARSHARAPHTESFA